MSVRRRTWGTLVMACFALTPLVQAASEEGGAHASGTMDFVGKVVNFLVLFGGLGYILRKPLKRFLEQRSQDIRRSLEEAENVRREAEAKRESIEGRLAGLTSEVEALTATARSEAEAEREKTLQAGRAEAERLRALAQQEIEAQLKGGLRELRQHAADKALALALGRVQGRLTPDIQSLLIDKAIDKLAEVHAQTHTHPTVRPRAH